MKSFPIFSKKYSKYFNLTMVFSWALILTLWIVVHATSNVNTNDYFKFWKNYGITLYLVTSIIGFLVAIVGIAQMLNGFGIKSLMVIILGLMAMAAWYAPIAMGLSIAGIIFNIVVGLKPLGSSNSKVKHTEVETSSEETKTE